MKVDLLIIDPQNDFCKPDGALAVPGAEDDMKRLANLIKKYKNKWHQIHVTMDSHHYVDIGHPIFYIDSNGNHPTPITIISEDDVKNGVWRAYNPHLQNWLENYVHQLDINGRYPLTVWPVHCLIGYPGFQIFDPVGEALLEWEKKFKIVDKVTKGSNFYTEHYSAVQADVPDPSDPSTSLNTSLIETLKNCDIVALAGEALSHCLAETVKDVADNFGEDNIKKLVLLEDATSPVPGFESNGDQFVNDMVSRGMQISTTDKFLK